MHAMLKENTQLWIFYQAVGLGAAIGIAFSLLLANYWLSLLLVPVAAFAARHGSAMRKFQKLVVKEQARRLAQRMLPSQH